MVTTKFQSYRKCSIEKIAKFQQDTNFAQKTSTHANNKNRQNISTFFWLLLLCWNKSAKHTIITNIKKSHRHSPNQQISPPHYETTLKSNQFHENGSNSFNATATTPISNHGILHYFASTNHLSTQTHSNNMPNHQFVSIIYAQCGSRIYRVFVRSICFIACNVSNWK